MNLEYKQKYLKYKNKYLNLKLELEGGKKPNFDTDYYLYRKGGASWMTGARDNPKDAIDDSKVKLPLLVSDKGKDIWWDDWSHPTNATFEYLEKKYGGRFEKNGVFKKGGHLDKKGNYKPHSKGFISGHYHQYFGKLKTWEEDIKAGKKFFEEPKLLKDKETIFDNMDYYRANFIYGTFMFDEDSYKWLKGKFNASDVKDAIRANWLTDVISRLQITKKKLLEEMKKMYEDEKTVKLIAAMMKNVLDTYECRPYVLKNNNGYCEIESIGSTEIILNQL